MGGSQGSMGFWPLLVYNESMPKGIKGFQKGHPQFSVDWNNKQKGMRHSPLSEFGVGHTPWNKGKHHRATTIFKLKALWTPERKKQARLLAIERAKGRISWKHTQEYRDWRTAVFKRDNWTCQDCGQHGGTLNADHIKPQSLYPDLRFTVSNGRTLCRPCHKKTPTWGIGIYNMKRNYRL